MDLPPLEDADSAGDLLLVLETDKDGRPTQPSIRVSSKVLSLASPVFAAMLSPKFAEGQALLNATSADTPSLFLRDDDSQAMIWLCKALHFKQDVTVDISFSLLKKKAILSDKYDLVGALKPWSHVWLQKWPGSQHGVDDHAEMLWISYALGNEECFWRNSRSLMQFYTTEDLAAVQNEQMTAMLPERLLGRYCIPSFALNDISCNYRLTKRRLDCINNDREAVLIELQKTFEDIMAPLLKHECVAAKDHNRENNYRACDHLTKIGYYFAQLSKSGLWPITQKLQQTSLIAISAGLSKIQGYWDGDVSRNSYSTHCSSPKMDIKKLIEQAEKNATEKVKGLCLDCVKHGRINCRKSKGQVCEG